MKKIILILISFLLLTCIFTFIFHDNLTYLFFGLFLSFIAVILTFYLVDIIFKRKINNIFTIFFILSFYMFFVKGILILIDDEFSIYYTLNISFEFYDFLVTFFIVLILLLISFFSYGATRKEKMILTDLSKNIAKSKILIFITLISIVARYVFSITYNYGLPGVEPMLFIFPGFGGFVYLILAELSRIGLLYLFIYGDIKRNKIYVIIALIMMLLSSVLSVINGIKGEVVYLAIGVFAYYYIFSGKKISIIKLSVLLGISFVLYVIADFTRNSIELSNLDFGYFNEGVKKIIRRSTGFDSILNIVYYYKDGLFSLYYSSVEPIRFFTLNIAKVPENAISAAAPTFFGYFLIKGGFLLAIIASSVFGKLLGTFDKYIKRFLNNTKNMIFVVFYLNTLFFLIDFFFEGNLIVASKRFVISVFIFLILYFLKISRNTKNKLIEGENLENENNLDNTRIAIST